MYAGSAGGKYQVRLGPSLIALGISIGSGEWLLGPQAVGQFGFVGVGWVILVSARAADVLQRRVSRYVMATGEAPVVGWGRVPPGYLLWVPLSVFVVIFAFIAGGWAASAGQGVYALVHGTVPPAGAEEPRLWAIALLVLVFLITVLGQADQPRAGAGQLGDGQRDPGRAARSSTCSSCRSTCGGRAIRGFFTPAAPPGRHHRDPTRRAGRLHRPRLRASTGT